jgi:hypothetical protein
VQESWREDNAVNFTATLGIRGLLFDGGLVHQTIRQKEEEQGRRDMEEYLEKALLREELNALVIALQLENVLGE